MRSTAAHIAKAIVAGLFGIGLTLVGVTAAHADVAPSAGETTVNSTTMDNWPWT
ncbi:hypothetical protein [Micromonospora sp. C95]|uniref:hypothetical protein n=1 Tax=Micromonospora sp. C95 TaxID=2824882 RepID=UPI001B38C818|nr:hypothetical protein [Micromonospora sp. C95]MBQ1023730.1 hypothetical protein [Micromonospora sp. C95]